MILKIQKKISEKTLHQKGKGKSNITVASSK